VIKLKHVCPKCHLRKSARLYHSHVKTCATHDVRD